MTVKKTIAAFDFDGTLIRSDSFFGFIIFQHGFLKCFFGLCSNLSILLKLLLKQVSNHEAKQHLFCYFFSGLKKSKFDKLCDDFSCNYIPKKLKQKAFEKKQWHAIQGHELVVVSASIKDWIEPWANKNGFSKVIATEVEVENSRLTGKFQTRNCSGQQKVERFLDIYPNRDQYELYAYGDSKIDHKLLEISDYPYYKVF